MNSNLVFLPVLIQIGLTLSLYFALVKAKVRAVKQGSVQMDRIALHDDAWPNEVIKINNNIRNQFQVPVLFYVLVVVAWLTGSVNLIVHVLAWLFVLARMVHAFIHVGSNYVPLRRQVFTAGFLVIVILTVYLIYGTVASAAA
ncbi:MAPEG family protein [Gilvimarinus sp. F26214L]|uniref:MAPEG family protein n=1 Tax=Gilvimarinus sp. DZF01 TaxID=3461371 RepID=UPI0040462F40